MDSFSFSSFDKDVDVDDVKNEDNLSYLLGLHQSHQIARLPEDCPQIFSIHWDQIHLYHSFQLIKIIWFKHIGLNYQKLIKNIKKVKKCLFARKKFNFLDFFLITGRPRF